MQIAEISAKRFLERITQLSFKDKIEQKRLCYDDDDNYKDSDTMNHWFYLEGKLNAFKEMLLVIYEEGKE